jgi:hypothetical protein
MTDGRFDSSKASTKAQQRKEKMDTASEIGRTLSDAQIFGHLARSKVVLVVRGNFGVCRAS